MTVLRSILSEGKMVCKEQSPHVRRGPMKESPMLRLAASREAIRVGCFASETAASACMIA